MPMPGQAMPSPQPGAAPAGAGGAPGAPGGPQSGGPGASPMLTPGKAQGQQASGKVKVMMAMHILTMAIQEFGPGTPEGQSVLDALVKLTKKFGKSEEGSKQIMPAELMAAMQPAMGPGTAPPQAGKPPAPPGGGAPPMQPGA